MDYDVGEIQQNPARHWCPFTTVARHASLFHCVGQIFLQPLNLTHRIGSHDHEIIGKGGQPPQVKHHDVGGQFLGGDVDGQAGDTIGDCE